MIYVIRKHIANFVVLVSRWCLLTGYFMNLMSNTALPARGGSKAWLISPKFSTDAAPRCMAFYYYMFERTIDPSGPSLGSLRVHVLHHPLDGTKKPLTTIWRLNNHQGHRWLMAR